MKFTGKNTETVVPLMTANPAHLMGWTGKGEIARGKDADLVLLDADSQVGAHHRGRSDRVYPRLNIHQTCKGESLCLWYLCVPCWTPL